MLLFYDVKEMAVKQDPVDREFQDHRYTYHCDYFIESGKFREPEGVYFIVECINFSFCKIF